MSRNSHSIAAIFGKLTGAFSKLKIIGLDQSLLKYRLRIALISSLEYNCWAVNVSTSNLCLRNQREINRPISKMNAGLSSINSSDVI